jgi:nucleoside-triphosphatase
LRELVVMSGPPGVGKSTVVSRVILKLKSAGAMVGGCTTPEKRVKGSRVGFDIRNLTDGGSAEMASVSSKLGPRVGKYRVNLANLSSVGRSALSEAARRSEVIVVDEVGPMELVSPEFKKGVFDCIESGKPMLVVVHERMEDDLLVRLRGEASLSLEVSTTNRDELADVIVQALLRGAEPR